MSLNLEYKDINKIIEKYSFTGNFTNDEKDALLDLYSPFQMVDFSQYNETINKIKYTKWINLIDYNSREIKEFKLFCEVDAGNILKIIPLELKDKFYEILNLIATATKISINDANKDIWKIENPTHFLFRFEQKNDKIVKFCMFHKKEEDNNITDLFLFEIGWEYIKGRILFVCGDSEEIKMKYAHIVCKIDNFNLKEYMKIRNTGATYEDYLEFMKFVREK